MEQSKAKGNIVQFIKFALIGASNTLVTLIVGFVLENIIGVYAAQTVGYICGVLNSYIWNTVWTFRKERKRNVAEILKFLIVNAAVWAISLGIIAILKNALGLDVWWMSVMGENWFTKILDGEKFCMLLSTMVCIFINFLGNKLFVFKVKEKETGE